MVVEGTEDVSLGQFVVLDPDVDDLHVFSLNKSDKFTITSNGILSIDNGTSRNICCFYFVFRVCDVFVLLM